MALHGHTRSQRRKIKAKKRKRKVRKKGRKR